MLDNKIDDIVKVIGVIRDENFRKTLNLIPNLESSIKEIWKIINYITGNGEDILKMDLRRKKIGA